MNKHHNQQNNTLYQKRQGRNIGEEKYLQT